MAKQSSTSPFKAMEEEAAFYPDYDDIYEEGGELESDARADRIDGCMD